MAMMMMMLTSNVNVWCWCLKNGGQPIGYVSDGVLGRPPFQIPLATIADHEGDCDDESLIMLMF